MLPQSIWEQKLSPVLRQPGLNKKRDELCEILIETPLWQREKAISLVETYQGQICREINLIHLLEIKVPVDALPGLAKSRSILKIWNNSPVYALHTWPVSGEAVFSARDLGYNGKGVVAAVLDTGIAPHEDLVEPENRILAWYDLIDQKSEPYDDHGHGTYVAGIIAGNGSASRGKYHGIAPGAKLVGVKVLNNAGAGKLADLILGIEWCLDNQKALKIKVINLSLGTNAQDTSNYDPLCRITNLAWRRGVTVCTATGFGPDGQSLNSPAINPYIITGGGLDKDKTFTDEDARLNRLKKKEGLDRIVFPDLLVPGNILTSLKTDTGYCTMGGPSIYAPVLTGSIALVLQKYPFYRPVQIKRLLQQNTDDAGLGKVLQGAGVLNLDKVFAKSSTDNLIQYPRQPMLKKDWKPVNGNFQIPPPKRNESCRFASQGNSGETPFEFLGKICSNFINWFLADLPQKNKRSDKNFFESGLNQHQLNSVLKAGLDYFGQNYEELMPKIGKFFGLDFKSDATQHPINGLLKTIIGLVSKGPTDSDRILNELVMFLLSQLKSNGYEA